MKISEESLPKPQNREGVKNADFRHYLYIESYGVKIGISANQEAAVEPIRKSIQAALVDHFTEIDPVETEHHFRVFWNLSRIDSFFKNGEELYSSAPREKLPEYFGSEVRRTVAEFATDRVFIHAGVVGWKGKAIIIPANSMRGKTSLTAALVKRGALYYSDEYAILDGEGFVHPFPKTLSVRGIIDEYEQVERTVESFGGKAASEKAPVGMFLLTEYKRNARWKPKILSPAQGTLEIIAHTVPIRTDPAYVLRVLKQAVKGVAVVKSKRGDAARSAERILDFFEKNCL
jgi:hypothetical protein